LYVNYFYPQDVVQAGDTGDEVFYSYYRSYCRRLRGSLFTYGDSVKNDIYKDNQSAEDILRLGCQILRVDYQKQIPGDKIAAV